MEQKININEIFKSLQGEGIRVLKPATFIRFQGCNYGCNWCDTPEAQGEYSGKLMTITQILLEVKALGLSSVVITGGEPFYQVEALMSLVSALEEEELVDSITIFTNGYASHLKSDLKKIADELMVSTGGSFCVDCKGPSSGVSDMYGRDFIDYFYPKLTMFDAVKFIVDFNNQEDIEFFRNSLAEFISLGCRARYLLSPVFSLGKLTHKELNQAIRLCMELEVSLSLQLHKLLGIK